MSGEHLCVVVTKETRATKIGMTLQNRDDRGDAVQISDVSPNCPLAGIVQEGDTLVAIDDVPCLSGHEKASQRLIEKVGDVILTIKPSQPQGPGPTYVPLLLPPHTSATDAGGEVDLGVPTGALPLNNTGRATTGREMRETPLTAAAEAMVDAIQQLHWSQRVRAPLPLPPVPTAHTSP